MNRTPILFPRVYKPNIVKGSVYGYIYITTHLDNNHKYLGKRKGTKFDPNYYGSGNIIEYYHKKYGINYLREHFIVEPIDWARCLDELDAKEKLWIEITQAKESENWYNIAQGGEGYIMYGDSHPNKGKPLPLVRRISIGYSLKGRFIGENNPMYGKSGEDSPSYGRIHTKEEREKIKIALKGKKKSKEHCERMSRDRKGKLLSEKQKECLDNLHELDDLSDRISSGLKNSEKFQKIPKKYN